MRNRFYTVIRDLHLYLGLFVSPFVLAFAVSVVVLVHPAGGAGDVESSVRTIQDLKIEPGIEGLVGRARVDAVRSILDQAGVRGEIGFVRHDVNEHRLVAPVEVPGRTTTVEIDLTSRAARISTSEKGVLNGLALLHKSPGPHLVDLRMNWLPMLLWRGLTDATVYLVLFISASGIYLWALLRSERRAGIVLLAAGALSFAGIIYALIG